MARCNSSWLPVLGEPRREIWRPELTFITCTSKCWREAGKKIFCRMKVWSELFQRRVLTSAGQNFSSIHHVFLYLFLHVLPPWLFRIHWLTLLGPPQYNKNTVVESGSAFSGPRLSQKAELLVSNHSSDGSPSLVALAPPHHLRAETGQWALHFPGTTLVCSRCSIHKLNWNGLSHPQFGLLLTVCSFSNVRTTCQALSQTFRSILTVSGQGLPS